MEKKKKLKGFTLIELIIVLAIFSVILALVLSFIDPVSNIMKRTSTKERTAAYVDNITEYIDNSIHYAKFMRVYEGGYCDVDSTTGLAKPAVYTDDEAKIVKSMVDDIYRNAVNDADESIGGRVRVLKLINTPVDGCPQEGQIYESVYKFTARKDYEYPAGTVNLISDSTVSAVSTNVPIINPEHFEDYCYYYSKGFMDLVPITDSTIPERNPNNYKIGDTPISNDGDGYYSAIAPITYTDPAGATKTMEIRSGSNFAVNVTSYQVDKKRGTSNMEKVTYSAADGSERTVPVFWSPSHLTTASMALVNVMKASESDAVICCRAIRDEFGAQVKEADPDTGTMKAKFQPVVPADLPTSAYTEYKPTYSEADGLTDNLYIVYIVPDEINDTAIEYYN